MRQISRRSHLQVAIRLALLAGGSCLVAAGAARADGPSAASENTAARQSGETQTTQGLEEIFVTARKRQESALDVPMVITALGHEELERFATDDLYSLATRVPGMIVGDNIATIAPTISLRGVGNVVQNNTMDQSVSLNIDGLQLSQGYALNAGMFDVGQVEVLKGPQALFYGKNSPAGVISFRSADPTDETEVSLRLGYETEAEEKMIESILSGPVSESLKLRLATHYSVDNGYFRNLAIAPAGFDMKSPTTTKYGDDENWIVRGTALFKPSEVYDARLKLNYTYDFADNGAGHFQVAACPNGKSSLTGLPIINPAEDCKLDRDVYVSFPDPAFFNVPHNGVPFVKSDQHFGTLEQNLYLGSLTATSVTGYYEYGLEALVNGTSGGGLTSFATHNNFSNRQFTQELRLASDFASPVNFMLGAFYQDGRQRNHVRLDGSKAIAAVTGVPPIVQDVQHSVDIESISAFGQLRWDVTDQLELAGGARWTDERRDHVQENIGTPGQPLGRLPLLTPKIESDNVSPEFTATYKPTRNLTFFGSYRQGFKSGSFNTVTFIAPTTSAAFGDEEVEGFEVGLKTRLLDGRMSLNLAAYDYDYSGLQVGANEPTPAGTIALRVINATEAKVRGVDFDIAYEPAQIEGLSLYGAVGYNRARYGDFRNAPCAGNQTISEGCNQLLNSATGRFTSQDLTGQSLARAPEWVANAGFDQQMSVGRDMSLRFGANLAYTSEYYTSIINRPLFVQDAYTKANASISLIGPKEAWDVSLIGSNLGDKITAGACANTDLNNARLLGTQGQITGAATGGPAGQDSPICVAERGLEVWLRVTLQLGRLRN